MKEAQRITKLFEDLYEGSPWIDVNIRNTLKQLMPEQAARKILPGRNSIWEIVNHITAWRLNVLQRVKGKKVVSPDNNYFEAITDSSSAAWKKALEQTQYSQNQWLDFLKTLKEDDLAKVYDDNNMTYYNHIHGVLQHDSYHLGQIVLLTKLL